MTIDAVPVADASAPAIACSLTAERLRQRVSDLSALADRALRVRTPIHGGELLTFTAGERVEQELRAIIAAEASCCAFLAMDLRVGDAELLLEITGPDDARPIIAAMFDKLPELAARR